MDFRTVFLSDGCVIFLFFVSFSSFKHSAGEFMYKMRFIFLLFEHGIISTDYILFGIALGVFACIAVRQCLKWYGIAVFPVLPSEFDMRHRNYKDNKMITISHVKESAFY